MDIVDPRQKINGAAIEGRRGFLFLAQQPPEEQKSEDMHHFSIVYIASS